jgi:CHAD domain-containing protein
MEFELAADADAAAALARLKTLAACREGRQRGQAARTVWLDTPDHALLADGLIVAETRGVRRLELVVPGSGTWLPGQPAPVVAGVLADAVLPEGVLPEGLVPEGVVPEGATSAVAAFEGRRSVSVHSFAGSRVTLSVDTGSVRTVAAERAVARVGLSGEEQAVRGVALLIAEAVPVAVPIASLAAEAVALATGGAPRPRRRGAPVLPDEVRTVAEALAHILGHLIDVILAQAPLACLADGDVPDAVHQMRVAVRRARSALSIFRPALVDGALDGVEDGLKALGKQLGPARDWDVFADETVPAIQRAIPGDQRLERLAASVRRRRLAHRAELVRYLGSAAFRRLGIELAWFVAADGWRAPRGETESPSLEGFAQSVLRHRWKKLLSAGKRIEALDIAGLHAVRLRAKRVRYAAEMFAGLHDGKAAHRFIRRLSDLQQRLGVLNDGAVASHLLEELGGGGRHAYAAGAVAGVMAARAERIRPRIVKAFERFSRQHAYWA